MDGSIKKQLKKGLQSEEYRLVSEYNRDQAGASLENKKDFGNALLGNLQKELQLVLGPRVDAR